MNLTDGLDGLATGASTMVFARVHGDEHLAEQPVLRARRPATPATRSATRSTSRCVAAALTGACFGFLWWNASPAKIFMGDTGSLALGGALAGLAIFTRTELLLVVLGGLFVAHHHVGDPPGRLLQAHRRQADVPDGAAAPPLRAKGWDEITVVVRFWIITGLCVAAGLGIFYAEWVAGA